MIVRKYTKSKKLDNGNTNLGFTPIEMIKEYIDNEKDADAKEIHIKLFKNLYTMYTDDKNKKNITAERYGVAIIGNGGSFTDEELKNVFQFGSTKDGYSYYKDRTGKFHYGTISGLGVGSSVKIMTKREKEINWRVKEIHFNSQEMDTYESDIYQLDNDKIEQIITQNNIEDTMGYGTIVLVEGIEERKISNEKLFIDNLVKDLSVTYYDYLQRRNSIKVISGNNEYFAVKGVDPLGLDLPHKIRSTIFAEYEITLLKILRKMDEIARNSILESLKDVPKEVIDEEKITIKLCKLGINKNNKASVKKKYPEISEILYPSMDDAGMYLKRLESNGIGRIIGQAIKITFFGQKTHNVQNLFRGLITFSPIFDELFGIQINKNRNAIDGVIKEVLEECILSDESLVGSTVGNRIKNATSLDETPKEDKEELSDEEKREKAIIKINKIEANLRKYNQNLEPVDKVRNLINNSNVDPETINIEILMLESKYINDTKKRFKDVEIMIKRVKKLRESKFLSDTSSYESFEGLSEPNIEVDVYGVFCRLYSEAPELFDFEPIMYHTQEGIDYLAKLDESVYNQLDMPRRIGELSKTICQELGIAESRYSYVEFKNVLEKEMNHSLELVSHIVCWRRKKGLGGLRTEYGTYKFNDKKDMLINEDGNKIKVIYIREILKKVTNGSWVTKDTE